MHLAMLKSSFCWRHSPIQTAADQVDRTWFAYTQGAGGHPSGWEGMKNREIARALHVTEHTVSNYLYRIFEKLGVSSRVQLILHSLSRQRSASPFPPFSVFWVCDGRTVGPARSPAP
jgi:hypothetical protein